MNSPSLSLTKPSMSTITTIGREIVRESLRNITRDSHKTTQKQKFYQEPSTISMLQRIITNDKQCIAFRKPVFYELAPLITIKLHN